MVNIRRLFSLKSATWLYPLQGIIYFASHLYLWPKFLCRLFPIAFLSAFIYTFLFVFTYLPQVAFLALFGSAGGLVWLNAVFLVLGEGAVIVALLFEAFFVDEVLIDIFDAVLLERARKKTISRTISMSEQPSQYEQGNGRVNLLNEVRHMIGQTRILHLDENNNGNNGKGPLKVLGKLAVRSEYAPFSFRQVIEFILLLPLNFIPIVGAPLFLVATGYRAGPIQHWRYFQLREFTKQERNQFVSQRRLRYTWFGTMALSLQLVPFLSMFFLLSTAVGSALWAADLEERRQLGLEYTANNENNRPRNEYRDEPV